MKNYVKEKDCLRKSLFSPFNEQNQPVSSLTPLHLCCSLCAEKCLCSSPGCKEKLPFEEVQFADPTPPEKVIDISEDDKRLIKSKRKELHQSSFSKALLYAPSGFVSGLTSHLIEEIIECACFANGPDYYSENLSISFEVAVQVDNIVRGIYEEKPSSTNTNIVVDKKIEEEKYVFSDFSSGEEWLIDEEI